ncbi:putative C6 transcription factor [Aspergillus mulundensis]|uniref:Putative Zn(II)2Cys6 transcription factor n=1 Tax=Aspergillus mulundensis TaxID=1810919 RepID=A0A3D8T2W6_9EURO|nr:putative Zn(II)2Cys6 transcription factor [Aspergillus mulundensis]RDW92893.1 putative Zn(II)2Cys6 transcription factor [Aspergillus mulundensis]
MDPSIAAHHTSIWERSPDESVTISVHGDREREVEVDAAPRKRRRKYIAKACNECKRRKIKCNGERPCGRCGRQRISCIYDNAHEPGGNETIGIERLYEQMNAMQAQISALTASVHALAQNNATGQGLRQEAPPRLHRRFSMAAKELTFQGPTTSGFSFDLAKSSLKERGIEVERNEDMTREPSPLPTPPSPSPGSCHVGDPLWSISKTEALRLCRVYDEEMGAMYPVVELDQLLHNVNLLYGPTDAGSWPRAPAYPQGDEGLDSDDVNILRLVFACALTAEASGSSELAMSLFETVRDAADHYVWAVPEIKSITLLALVAILYFQIDEETLAWRTIGIVERMCLEKGLHRRETLKHPAIIAAGKNRVLKLFWSVRVLDLRWSFGTGMPYSIDDSDIDPWLSEPEEDSSYLRVMIRYSRIAAKVWRFISAFNNTNEIKKDEMNYLDWQVQQWVATLPDSLRLRNPSGYAEGETRSLRRLRSLVYLRANQLRMLIHRPVLHSAAHMMRFPAESQTVVDMAKDSIRFITQLHASSDIYQLQQVVFNWFLVSALMALFLAVAQIPSQYSTACREEFYMALELVKGVSTRSYISRRLWKSIKGLRRLGPQLMHRQSDGDGATVEGIVDQAVSAGAQSQTPDGVQMTQELKEWFEAVGNLEDQIMGVGSLDAFQEGYMLDYSNELSSMMKDCF